MENEFGIPQDIIAYWNLTDKYNYYKKSKFGFRRIKVLLEKEFGVFKNINTVRRYMLHLGLKANIRQRRRYRDTK